MFRLCSTTFRLCSVYVTDLFLLFLCYFHHLPMFCLQSVYVPASVPLRSVCVLSAFCLHSVCILPAFCLSSMVRLHNIFVPSTFHLCYVFVGSALRLCSVFIGLRFICIGFALRLRSIDVPSAFPLRSVYTHFKFQFMFSLCFVMLFICSIWSYSVYPWSFRRSQHVLEGP